MAVGAALSNTSMSFPSISGILDGGSALVSPMKLGSHSARGLGSRGLRGATTAPETLDGEGHNSSEACRDRVGDPEVAEGQGEMETEGEGLHVVAPSGRGRETA